MCHHPMPFIQTYICYHLLSDLSLPVVFTSFYEINALTVLLDGTLYASKPGTGHIEKGHITDDSGMWSQKYIIIIGALTAWYNPAWETAILTSWQSAFPLWQCNTLGNLHQPAMLLGQVFGMDSGREFQGKEITSLYECPVIPRTPLNTIACLHFSIAESVMQVVLSNTSHVSSLVAYTGLVGIRQESTETPRHTVLHHVKINPLESSTKEASVSYGKQVQSGEWPYRNLSCKYAKHRSTVKKQNIGSIFVICYLF